MNKSKIKRWEQRTVGAALAIACPRCGAFPGAQCRGISGYAHEDRVIAMKQFRWRVTSCVGVQQL